MAAFDILIQEVGGELELSLPDVAQIDQQTIRRAGNTNQSPGKGRKDFIKAQRQSRRQPGHDHPDLIGPHLPIILLPGDIVTFKCAKPFVVDVKYDPGFLKPGDPVPPRSPFRDPATQNPFTLPQTSKQQSGKEVVEAEFNGSLAFINDVARHLFYKCTVWSNNLELDPDFICDR
jgi:hypothetical protein